MCHPNLKPDRDSARGLTPGTDKKGTRPESGGREAFPALDAERDPQRISAAPFLLCPLFPELRRTSRARPYCQCVLGLKPQAQSYSPFGTKNSIRSKYLSTFSKPHHVVACRKGVSTQLEAPYEGARSSPGDQTCQLIRATPIWCHFPPFVPRSRKLRTTGRANLYYT